MAMNMTVTCKTREVLTAIKKNREQHAKIVEEARVGYIEKAKEALVKKLDKLKSGKMVQMYIGLGLPEDHSEEYDTVIKMLEMHTGDTIELSANEVRQFIEDKWQWRDNFLRNNAVYSQSATALCND